MINYSSGTSIQLIACKLHSPAEIDLFLVSKKIIIKPFHFMKYITANDHRSACHPKDLFRGIILTFIHFTYIKYPSSCKWIAEAIKPSSGTACIIKNIPVAVRE